MALTEQSAERTAGLVERFKLISATSAQSGIDTQLVLQFAGQWLQSHLALQPREVTLQLDGADIEWRFDTTVLGKVLSALLDNALQHAEPVEGPLQIRLQLAIDAASRQLLLYFSDNGQGIRPELLDKIFDPFFTTKLGQGNLGLGLSIAYNQLQAIGGSLQHLPQQSGCCFLIRLPALTS